MRLSDTDAQLFDEAWWPLLDWVNAERGVVADTAKHSRTSPFAVSDHVRVRDLLWSDESLRQRFVVENPAQLGREPLALVESWDHRRAAMFCVLRHFKKHTVFLDDRQGNEAGYAVLGLASDLTDRLPEPPCLANAVLLPFGDRIVIDGILTIPSISLGPGIRRRQEALYRDIVERGVLRTSLLPEIVTPEVCEKRRNEVNERVGAAFVASLRTRRLSEKIISRDVAAVARLAALIAPRSLREGAGADLPTALARIEGALGPASDEILLGWKRFFTFLWDTDRISHPEIQRALADIKALGNRASSPR